MKATAKALLVSAAIASTAILSGCATPFPMGLFYTKVTMPLSVSGEEIKYSKKGEATCVSLFGCFASGDASIQEACKNGNLTKVKWVNYRANNLLGIYGKYTIVAYGD